MLIKFRSFFSLKMIFVLQFCKQVLVQAVTWDRSNYDFKFYANIFHQGFSTLNIRTEFLEVSLIIKSSVQRELKQNISQHLLVSVLNLPYYKNEAEI